MFDIALALLMGSSVAGGIEPCPESIETDPYFLDVCDEYFEGPAVYSASWQGSLAPRPAVQQVVLFRHDAQWLIRIAGYRWQRGTALVEHRRTEIAIEDSDAQKIMTVMDDATLERLAKGTYYGSENEICVDGARYWIERASNGERRHAARHSCADKGELHEIMSEFRRVALKYDPAFEGMLTGLRN